MRKDLVAGGASTVALMLLGFWILTSAALPVPEVLTNLVPYVALVGLGFLVLGMILKPAPKTKR